MARHRWRACAAAALWMAGCALVPLTAPLTVQAQACDATLLARTQSVYQALTGFQGEFRQEDRESDGRVLTAGGKIAYRKPGQMRWEYAPPNEQLLVTDGSTVWLYDPLLENVTVQPLEGLTEGTPLKFLLGAGNLTADFTCRAVTLKPPAGAAADGLVYLELVAKTEIPTVAFIQLGVRANSARLESFRTVDTQGNQRTVRLLNLKPTATFPPDHFVFKIPPDMEVIKK
jgi:outer membrane lipoprotein carrier protein